MSLQVSGLICDVAVRHSVGFIEAVARELRHQVEDLVSHFFRNAVFRGAGDEDGTVTHHFLLQLFTHGAAEKVSAAERVAADHLSDLHHLFLIHHDAVRFREH